MLSSEPCVWDKRKAETHGVALNDLCEVTQALPKETPQAPESPVGTAHEGLSTARRHRLAAKRNYPSVSNGQENEEVGDVVRRTQATVAPMPTAAFQVPETLFLPIAPGILVSGKPFIIGHQRPRFVVTDAP